MSLSSRQAKRRYSSKGFGLLEVIMASVIGLLVTFAMSKMFTFQMRSQRKMDVKADSQMLLNRIQTILSSEDTCTANFAEIMTNPEFDPQDTSNYDAGAAVRLGDGTVVKTGAEIGGVQTLSLKIAGEILPINSGKYDAALEFRWGGDRHLAGGELAPRNIPLLLTTAPVPGSTPARRKIIKCVAKSGVTGPEACVLIGGKWVNSIARCFFGGELKLHQYEEIDLAEFELGGPLEGAVIDECFFRYGSRTLSYRCFNTPVTSVPHCLFQEGVTPVSSSGWVLKYPTHTRVIRNCSRGVVIRVPDDKLGFLYPNEYAPGYFAGTPPAGADPITSSTTGNLNVTEYSRNFEILDSVLECQTRPEDANFRKCSQEDKGLRGQAGSCVFVNNARVYDRTIGQWISGYTGWISVTHSRHTAVKPSPWSSNRYTTTVEARGYKCTLVKYLQDSADPTALDLDYNAVDDPGTPAVDSLLTEEERAKKISGCLFVGLQSSQTTPAIPAPGNLDAPRGIGAYLHRYSCNNAEIGLDDLAGDGASGGEAPSLTEGTCWYVTNMKLSSNYKLNADVNNTNAVYTGWVRLLENIPDGKYEPVAAGGTLPENALKHKSGSSRRLLAVPCNGGLKLPPADEDTSSSPSPTPSS